MMTRKELLTMAKSSLDRMAVSGKNADWDAFDDAYESGCQAIAALTAEQPQKVENRAILGWDMDKRLDDFTVVADALRTEGQQSRADVVTYLIERCRLAEQTPEPNRVVVSQAPIDLSKPGAIEKYVPGFGRSKEEVIPVYAAPPQPTAETEEAVNGLVSAAQNLCDVADIPDPQLWSDAHERTLAALDKLKEAKHGQ